jgi:ribonuclease G
VRSIASEPAGASSSGEEGKVAAADIRRGWRDGVECGNAKFYSHSPDCPDMSEEILINFTPQETRVAVMHQGVAQELHIERSASRGFVGNIYVGRIVRILPGMQSAFIDIGLGRTAFLHVADIREPRPSDEPLRPIERLLFEGQSILVQVIKDPMGSKGARLSTQVSIAGRMLVYLPQDKHIGISQRIERESDREALREKLGRLVPGGGTGWFHRAHHGRERDRG